MTALHSVRRVLQLWWPAAPELTLGALATLCSVLALAGLAYAAGSAPVAVAGITLVAVLRVFGAGRVLLRYAERLATHRATFRALTVLRVWMFRGLARRSAGGLGFLRRGDALARLVGDVDALDGLYLRILIPLLAAAVLLPVLLVLLGAQDPWLAAGVGALFLAASLGIPLLAARGTLEQGGRLARAGAGLRVAAVDALAGMREVRAFGHEGRALALVQARESALFDAQRTVARKAALAQAAASLCASAALLLLLLAGLPGHTVLPALLLTLAAFEAAAVLPRSGALAGHVAAAASRVIESAEALPDHDRPSAPLPAGTGLRLESVRFAWPGRSPTFDGLAIDIPAGSRVAILGPSGAGKSTLAALLLKVVEPDAGRVLLGGADLATLRAGDVRGRMAWLSQSTHVFADTVRANLLLGRPGGR